MMRLSSAAQWASGTLLLAFAVMLAIAIPVLATVPQQVGIQGRLTNSTGGLMCGTFNMTIEIYDAASAGNRLFVEYRDNVTDSTSDDCRGPFLTISSSPTCEGIFNINLGSTLGCPVNSTIFDTANAYVQLTINNSVLTPRHRITSGGYTFRTNVTDYVNGSTTGGTVLGPLNPITDNVLTLGTSALRWLAGWFSNLTVSGNVTVSGTNVGIVFPDNTFQTTAPVATTSPWDNSSTRTFIRSGYPTNVNITGNLTVGGCAFATYVGLTTSTYNGALSSGSDTGYVAAKTICNAAFGGSHLCTTDEVLESIRCGLISTFTDGGQGWVAEGPPGYTANANDCIGWTSSASDSLGAFWIYNTTRGGDGWLINCASSKKLSCCK
jgi:hypothetical protein